MMRQPTSTKRGPGRQHRSGYRRKRLPRFSSASAARRAAWYSDLRTAHLPYHIPGVRNWL